jgi:HK97 gp10 family phage protein
VDGVGVEVKGTREIVQRMTELSAGMRTASARRAIVAGARVIRDLAKRGVRQKTKTLRKAIIASYSKKRTRRSGGKSQVALVRVRGFPPKKGERPAGNAFYAGWVEFGHLLVPRGAGSKRKLEEYKAGTRKGVGRGIVSGREVRRRAAQKTQARVRAFPYLQPAYTGGQQIAYNTMIKVMSEELDKRLAKARAKK